MSRGSGPLTILVVILAMVTGSAPASAEPPAEGRVVDLVCGPRCVQHVLDHFGKPTDLGDLIREMQWPAFERGSSVAAVEESLNKRGVHTRAVRVGTDLDLHWPHPAIVLVRTDDSELGHFVVQEPSDEVGKVTAWVGLNGHVTGDARQFAARRTGVIVLTAPEPIPDSAVAFTAHSASRSWHRYWWLGLAAALVMVLAGLAVRQCTRFRRAA